MHAQEIMRGNYVIIDGVEEQVYSNFFDYDEGADYINDRHINSIKPIELTEKWLIDFGFKILDEKLYCKRYRLNRVDIYKMISGNYPFYFRFNQVDLNVKHVHQFQNLYFVLSKKELKKD